MASGLEQKDIKYSGYTTLPDDYQTLDGTIAFSSGAIFESGGLKAIPDAWRQKIVVEETVKVYIHHTVNYYHYVVVYQKEEGILIYIIDREVAQGYIERGELPYITALEDSCTALVVDTLVKEEDLAGETFVELVCVGNTLIVSTDKDMHYYLCKAGVKLDSDGKDFEGNEYLTKWCTHPYLYLGNKVPSVSIEFGLDLECKSKTYFDTGVAKGKTEDGDGNTSESKNHANAIIGVSFYKEAGSNSKTYQLDKPFTLKEWQTVLVRSSADYNDVCNIDERTRFRNTSTNQILEVYHTNSIYTMKRDVTYDALVVYSKDDNKPSYGTIFVELIADSYFNGNYYIQQTRENYEAVFGCINKFVADYGENKNKFIHPFFVRYAVRLYDSSVCEISPPILMTPNSGYAPFVWCNNSDNDKDGEADNITLYAFIADLKLKMLDTIGSNWEDIIQSIDIYVSQPIYPYDQGKEYTEDEDLFAYKDHVIYKSPNYPYEYTEVRDEISNLSFGIGNLIDTYSGDTAEHHRCHNLRDVAHDRYGFDFYYSDELESLENNPWRITQVAPKDEESLDQEIKDKSSFYLIKKITFDELKNYTDDFTALDLECGTLSSLEGRESLSEDTIQYERIIGGQMFSFNNRLHIFGGSVVFKDLVFPSLQVQYNDYDNTISATNTAYVYIRTTEGVRIIKTTFSDVLYTAGFIWLFYPDNRAFQVILSLNSGERDTLGDVVYKVYKFPLTEHNFLNGAQFFLRTDNGFSVNNDDLAEYVASMDDIPSEDYINNTIQATSIYVSEVDNPLTFLNSTAVTAGSGKVLAMSTAAQAMSQGQFGQYPVYVFTDEGIWVLSVAETGVYNTSQPLSRDVVINADSITQLDSSVLFVTSRGIMEVAGSKVVCITDSIDGESGQFDLTALPYFTQLFKETLGYDDESVVTDILNKWAQLRFFDFIKDCGILYDYTHQRIIVYNSSSPLGYVYSISSKSWSIMFTNLRQTILSYPNSLALREMTSEEVEEYSLNPDKTYWELVDMSEYAIDHMATDEETSNEDELLDPMLFVTRPLKFGMPDIYKSLDSIIQRGYFQQSTLENHITASVLYASTDLFNWVVVGQSKTEDLSNEKDTVVLSQGHAIRNLQGTPYKYYRVAVACQLTKKESINGCSVLYLRKDDNTLR